MVNDCPIQIQVLKELIVADVNKNACNSTIVRYSIVNSCVWSVTVRELCSVMRDRQIQT